VSGQRQPPVPRRLDELVFGLGSEIEEERKLCLTWLAQLGTPDVLPYLERFTNDGSASVRQLARQLSRGLNERLELGKDHPWGHDPVELLVHPTPKARLAGALLCYEKQSPELKSILVERIKAEDDPFVLASLVKALRHYPEPAVIELLSDHLLDPDPRIRSNTIESLMCYEHQRLFRRISHMLNDPDDRVRGTVLIYLAKRQPDKIRPLLDALAKGSESWKRRAARHAFHGLCWELPLCLNLSERAREVRDLFADRSFQSRVQAVCVASELALDEKLSVLRNQLLREQHPQVIVALVRALGAPGQSEALALLSRYLESDDPQVRTSVVEGVGRIGGTAGLRLIEPLIDDPSPRVRSAALVQVDRLKKRRSLDTLRVLLDSEKSDDLAGCLIELSRLPAGEAYVLLESLVPVLDDSRRRQVVELLDRVSLHGPAQGLVDPLRTLCREHTSDSGGQTPPEPGAGPSKNRRTTRSVRSIVIEGVASGHVQEFALIGAEVVRLWETKKIFHQSLESNVSAVLAAEESLSQGVLMQENVHLRHQLLCKLGVTAMDLAENSLIDHPLLLKRIESVWASLEPSPQTPRPPLDTPRPSCGAASRPGDGAGTDEPAFACAAPASTLPSALSVSAPALLVEADQRARAPGYLWGALSLLLPLLGLVLIGLHTVQKLGSKAVSVSRPSTSVVRPSETTRTPSTANAQALISSKVTWSGRVIEIRQEGKFLVLEGADKVFAVLVHVQPLSPPSIGEVLSVTGDVTVRDASGRYQLEIGSFRESIRSERQAQAEHGTNNQRASIF